jgi:hypothetical protein
MNCGGGAGQARRYFEKGLLRNDITRSMTEVLPGQRDADFSLRFLRAFAALREILLPFLQRLNY